MVSAFTLNYVEEAVGIARAARACAMPVAISFTLETDGRLPSGDSLQRAIEITDEATAYYPVYYMINCAHPSHFEHGWKGRAAGASAFAACAPTPRSAAPPSSTNAPISTTAIRTSLASNIGKCASCCRGCRSSAVAAVPTTGMWSRFAGRWRLDWVGKTAVVIVADGRYPGHLRSGACGL